MRLTLKREPVAELTTEDLLQVRGGDLILSEPGGGCTSFRACYSGPVACSINCQTTFNTCGC